MHQQEKKNQIGFHNRNSNPDNQDNEKKKEQEPVEFKHPAWDIFLANYAPAEDRNEAREYLTTSQILDRLNNIVYEKYFDETGLVKLLLNYRFKTAHLEDSETSLWMIRPR